MDVVAAPSTWGGTDRLHAGGGLGEGQVENQVGNTREQLFTPRLRFQTLPELNGWLADRCIADAKTTTHPEIKDRTIWEVFEAERRALIGYPGPFDGFHEGGERL